ncbi:hypothetical protein LTR33_001077 [Friedmanniomyces endolithicus]|nr:hypothetical protein LTR33_001077 [Friedmanniomyces endolithicus]
MNFNGTAVTQAQREQLAQRWLASTQAQQLSPGQSEQFAQQIRSGDLDHQVQQNCMAQASVGQSMTTSFQTPFGEIQIPGFMPPMQPFPSMTLAGMPQVPMPAMQFPAMTPFQMPVIAPMFPPLMPEMHSPFAAPNTTPAIPQPFDMGLTAVQGYPQPFSQTVNFPGGQATRQAVTFPGGSANHQNINYSGRNGNAQVSYSSSNSSGHWSSHGSTATGHPALPSAAHYPQNIPVQSAQPIPIPQQAPIGSQHGFDEPEPMPPIVAPPAYFEVADSSAAQAQAPSQNSRLHDAFAQQLNEETYFSNPPGAPDRSAGAVIRGSPRGRVMAQNPLGEKICPSLLLKGPTLVDASSSTYSSQRESMECRHAVLPYRRTSPPLRLSVARADAVRSTVIGQANSRTDQGLGVAIPQLANIIHRSGNVMGFAPRQTMLARRKTFVHCGCLQECGALHFTSTDLNNDASITPSKESRLASPSVPTQPITVSPTTSPINEPTSFEIKDNEMTRLPALRRKQAYRDLRIATDILSLVRSHPRHPVMCGPVGLTDGCLTDDTDLASLVPLPLFYGRPSAHRVGGHPARVLVVEESLTKRQAVRPDRSNPGREAKALSSARHTRNHVDLRIPIRSQRSKLTKEPPSQAHSAIAIVNNTDRLYDDETDMLRTLHGFPYDIRCRPCPSRKPEQALWKSCARVVKCSIRRMMRI